MAEVAVQSRMQEEVVVEQPQMWGPDNTNGGGDINSVYYDKNEGMWKCHHCIWTYKNGNTWGDHVYHKSFSHGSRGAKLPLSLSDKNLGLEDINIPQLMNAVMNSQNNGNYIAEEETLSGSKASTSLTATEANVVSMEHGVEESDDDDDIEEVELEFERSFEKVHTHTPYCPNCNSQITKVVLRRRIKKKEQIVRPDDKQDLLGCLSCFRVFIPSGGGSLNPLKIFGRKPKPEIPQIVEGPHKNVDGSAQGDDKGKKPVGSNTEEQVSTDKPAGKLPVSSPHVPLLHGSRPRGDVTIDFGDGIGNSGTEGSKSVEILRCIVYGGLMELIASLSVVSSAAASDTKTLNIIAIGFATVISSIFVFGNNLIEMKKESPSKNYSNEQTLADRYEEHLGKRGNFALHATFAMLSFLFFGLIPPVVYGFAFRESDNKDYKIIAVAAAAFACVFILAIGKAYVGRQKKLSDYVKTILYYVTIAVSVSGVSYAAGDLAKILMEKFGWFETTPTASDNVAAWASY